MSNFSERQNKWPGPAYAAYALSDGPRFGEVDTSGYIKRASVEGQKCSGIINGVSAAQGDHVSLILDGPTEIELGGTITAGQYAQSSTVGKALVAASGDWVMGRMIVGGVDGEKGWILLNVEQHQVA